MSNPMMVERPAPPSEIAALFLHGALASGGSPR
jgi:hypothetical protein